MKIIAPIGYYEVIDAPLIFLGGPISCAPRWQEEVIRIISNLDDNIIVANPRQMFDETLLRNKDNNWGKTFIHQRAWERYYLEYSSINGCILFWLEEQATKDSMAYAATTRFELGQWIVKKHLDKSIGLVVGANSKFQALNVIKFDISVELSESKIHDNIYDLCEEAVKIACSNYKKNDKIKIKPLGIDTSIKIIELDSNLEELESI